MTSQTFYHHCIEYITLVTCAKFYDHWSNNNNVTMGALMPPITDGSNKPMSNRVKVIKITKADFYRSPGLVSS